MKLIKNLWALLKLLRCVELSVTEERISFCHSGIELYIDSKGDVRVAVASHYYMTSEVFHFDCLPEANQLDHSQQQLLQRRIDEANQSKRPCAQAHRERV